jgi:hypothetical protein
MLLKVLTWSTCNSVEIFDLQENDELAGNVFSIADEAIEHSPSIQIT